MSAIDTEPRTAGELAEVLVTMRHVLGGPEEMEDPRSRAIYLLDADRLAAANRRHETEGVSL